MLQEELNASRKHLASTAVDSAKYVKSPAIASESLNFTDSRIVEKPFVTTFGQLNTEDDEATQ